MTPERREEIKARWADDEDAITELHEDKKLALFEATQDVNDLLADNERLQNALEDIRDSATMSRLWTRGIAIRALEGET